MVTARTATICAPHGNAATAAHTDAAARRERVITPTEALVAMGEDTENLRSPRRAGRAWCPIAAVETHLLIPGTYAPQT